VQLITDMPCVKAFYRVVFCIISNNGVFLSVIGATVLVIAYIRVESWLQTSYRQTYRIRATLLQAVLRQEIGWFDTHDAGELGTRLAESVAQCILFYRAVLYYFIYLAYEGRSKSFATRA